MEHGFVMGAAGLLRTWETPLPEEIGTTVEEFLRRLGRPTWLRIPGRDRSRSRAVSTLLHGNEPSGVRAVFQWIRSGRQPVVDLVCFIGAVEAALALPGFANRFLPGRKDLNRCFREGVEGLEGQLVGELLQRFREEKPEALIDLHNISGRSPAYGVTTQAGNLQKSLVSLFSDHLVLTDLRLGTLMEATEHDFPTITVECGGANDPRSDEVAMEGLTRYAMSETLERSSATVSAVCVFQHPIRVELREGATVSYAVSPDSGVDLTLRLDADRFNFGVVKPGEIIGWVGACGLGVLVARGAEGRNQTQEIFTEEGGKLIVSQPAHLLMVTTNATIATSDCLFYFLPADS